LYARSWIARNSRNLKGLYQHNTLVFSTRHTRSAWGTVRCLRLFPDVTLWCH
jgi:hypothetical protein